MDRCRRCGREAPPQVSEEFLTWEVLEDGETLVCEGCLTSEEHPLLVTETGDRWLLGGTGEVMPPT